MDKDKMNDEETIDAEFMVVEMPARDYLGEIEWKMKGGQRILVKKMEDSHVRNSALFLMGMGYQKCLASEEIRIAWLTIFRMEWERRQLAKASGTKKFNVYSRNDRLFLDES